MKKNELEQMEEFYGEINKNKRLTTLERGTLYLDMKMLYRRSVEVQAYWEHHPSQRLYKNRFVKREIPKNVSVIKKANAGAFDDGINYDTPEYGGLYLIGSTYFNPITDEKFYWIKVGLASSLNDRMTHYNTCCAMLYRIDYLKITDSNKRREVEHSYHQCLKAISLATCNHNKEWFLVDRETYLGICEKGFSYFN